jgi:hypothetical protein
MKGEKTEANMICFSNFFDTKEGEVVCDRRQI